VPGSKRPWSIAPEEDSHQLDALAGADRESRDVRSRPRWCCESGFVRDGPGCVTSSAGARSCGITVSIADGGSGVRHFGQNSPASWGTMTAAQVGQARTWATIRG
jgi:hypothetical protein